MNLTPKKCRSRWVSYIKNTIAEIAPHFTMKRQLDDYIRLYYNKLISRSEKLDANGYERAKEIAAWKRKVLRVWEGIEVVSIKTPDSSQKPLDLGQSFKAEIVLNLDELTGEDIGIEVLFGTKVNDVVPEPTFIRELTLEHKKGNLAYYVCHIEIDRAGVYDYVFRLFPRNPMLPHRQDFPIVKWI